MGWMRKVVVGTGLVGALALVSVGGAVWGLSEAALDRTFEVHRVDFPIPFPLDQAEVAELRAERLAAGADPADPLAGVDLDAVAAQRAAERGKHLVESRYPCGNCHGADFGGGVVVDDPLIGRIVAPNLTTGRGSRTLAYQAADWDRMVRHGVQPDDTAGVMPSQDFQAMSDRELSDIVSYVRSKPPVDLQREPSTFGPLGRALLAAGQIRLEPVGDVNAAHAPLPPLEAPDVTFGEHLAQACTGCHRRDFTGGPILGGDPSWPAAADLTHLDGWDYADFERALRQGRRPDGRELRAPMSEIPKLAANMSDTEIQAIWAFLLSRQTDPNGGA